MTTALPVPKLPVPKPVAPKQAGAVRQEWLRLAAATTNPPRFDPAMIAPLPETARRWLTHAISPGTPLWQFLIAA